MMDLVDNFQEYMASIEPRAYLRCFLNLRKAMFAKLEEARGQAAA
jgi:hypothetical protein